MFATPAFAQSTGAAGQSGGAASLIGAFLPFLILIVAFVFIVHLPQQRRQKAFRAMIDAVKKGDSVVTAGGIAGKVTKVEERFVEVEIATGVKVRVVKATLAEVTPLGAAKPAND